jgi:hypothetical protein
MATTTSTLQWSESKPLIDVQTSEQLDQLLDEITATCNPDFPVSVILEAHGFQAHILLGLPESFIYLDEVSPTRHFITVGGSYIDGFVGFHLFGQHHTEFERRHLIPTATARRVLREFFDTGQRPSYVEWEEGLY